MYKRAVVLLVLLLFGLSLQVTAPEETVFDPQDPFFSDDIYSNEAAYLDPAFYAYTDISEWNWNYVKDNWDKVDFTREEIYFYPELYSNLNDHTIIDSDAYFSALGCNSCSIISAVREGVDGLQSLIYSQEGISHLEGDFVSIPGSYPSGVSFVVEEDVIVAIYPSDATSLVIPDTDSLTVQILDSVNYDGNTFVGGIINFYEGQPYLAQGDSIEINGVLLHRSDENIVDDWLRLYFDGEDHDFGSISFDKDEGLLRIKANSAFGLDVIFQPGNPFIPIEDATSQNLYLEQDFFDSNDFVSISPQGIFTEVIIENRGDEIIPLVTVDGNVNIRNGNNQIDISGNTVSYRVFEEDYTSSPFVVNVLPISTEFGPQYVLGVPGDPQKLVFDDYNNLILVSRDLPAEESECYDCIHNLPDGPFAAEYYTQRIISNSNIRAVIFDSGESGSEFQASPESLRRLSEAIEDLPPNVRDSIHQIRIVPRNRIEDFCGENAGGCANYFSRRITISENFHDSLIYHEGGHTFHFVLEEDHIVTSAERRAIMFHLEIDRRYGSVQDAPENVRNILNRLERNAEVQTDPMEEWRTIATSHGKDPVYGRDLGERTVAGRNAARWSDGTRRSRNGCVTAYGCNNIEEDIAETVEATLRHDQNYWQERLDPEGIFYDYRFSQKLDWLLRYGGITQERYNEITTGLQ